MLKKALKITLVILVVIIAGFVIFVYARHDRTFEAPYPDVKVSTDSAVIARGRYLVYGPAHCADCHAPFSEHSRVDKGEEVPLSGGLDFHLPFGTVHAPNITSDEETGIGKLTAPEIARALRYGVRHDGKAVLDFMPFYDLGEQDLTAVISFLKTQPPVNNKRPDHEWNFAGKAVLAMVIKPMGDGDVPPTPPADSTVSYGQYLATNVANCRGCHTVRSMVTGEFTGAEFAGPSPFDLTDSSGQAVKGKHVNAPNITPDPETGRLAGWSQKDFIKRFRTGRIIPGSPMPWGPFSRMTDLELVAIYKFLQTVPPVKNVTPLGIQEGDAE